MKAMKGSLVKLAGKGAKPIGKTPMTAKKAGCK
jgi:hypothetical protein